MEENQRVMVEALKETEIVCTRMIYVVAALRDKGIINEDDIKQVHLKMIQEKQDEESINDESTEPAESSIVQPEDSGTGQDQV